MSSRDIISVYTALPVARASRHHQGPGWVMWVALTRR